MVHLAHSEEVGHQQRQPADAGRSGEHELQVVLQADPAHRVRPGVGVGVSGWGWG